MATSKTRVFPIRLPHDHPIYSVPETERADKMRQWIALGIEAEQIKIEDVIRNVIRQEFSRFNIRVHDNKSEDPPSVNIKLANALEGFLNM